MEKHISLYFIQLNFGSDGPNHQSVQESCLLQNYPETQLQPQKFFYHGKFVS